MLRSMFTAINSLGSHQLFLDVVADNLANANTVGFKSSRVSFQTQFAQMMQVGTGPTADLGGINPLQIGLGVRMGAVSPVFSQGALQGTNRNSDLAIQGDGFFIYAGGGQNYYSRDGGLQMDAEGYLVHGSTGLRLQGWTAITSGSTATIDTGMPIGGIQLPFDTALARATTNATVGGNLSSETAIGDSFDVTMGVYDSLGVLQSITVTYTRTANDTWDWAASGNGATGTGTVTFDTDGQYVSGGGQITIPGTNGAANTVFDLDLTGMTMLADDSTAALLNQDGLAAGTFNSFFVAPGSGEIYGVYSNGMQQLLGQVALANFVNPDGLIRTGQNMWQESVNAGAAQVGAPASGGNGAIASGYLEGSNVDMAQEFTNMILAQRGFQASSRVITTSDEILQELVNLKR
ncbi:MAG: flagellar hook protein FlgE [Anaerolineales bacterium]|nr:flagellar hook protein FlgE [Anaerolineales bacterium]